MIARLRSLSLALLSCSLSCVLFVPLSAGYNTARSEPIERPFNQITALIVSNDLRSIQLFGIFNPLGPPQAIPYERLFADAFALPNEDNSKGVFYPGFSLELSSQSSAQLPVINKKIDDAYRGQLIIFVSKNKAAHDAFVESSLAQALPEALDGVRSVFKAHGYTDSNIDKIIAPVNSVDELHALVAAMFQTGLVRADDNELDLALRLAVDSHRTTKGSVFFFPGKVIDRYMNLPTYSEPHFYGIESKSQLARVTLEGDVALKQLAADNRLKATLPFHQTDLEWHFKNVSRSEIMAAPPTIMNVNLNPRHISFSTSSDGRIIAFDHEDVAIKYEPKDNRRAATASDLKYAEFLTSHFDDYAHQIPELWMVRELYKIIAVARYLKAKGVALSVTADDSWNPPSRIPVIWAAASIGTGEATEEAMGFYGGVNLGVTAATTTSTLSAQKIANITAATAQLDAVLRSGGSGVCYDVGCNPGVPLGFIKIGATEMHGAASLNRDTIAKMRARPDLSPLLDAEQTATTSWKKTQDDIRGIEAKLVQAQNPADKGKLQVDLSTALQKASNAKSVLDTARVKVEDGAKKLTLVRD